MQDNKRLKRKVRRSYTISTISIALVLFLLGSSAYLIGSAIRQTEKLKEDIALYIWMRGDADSLSKVGVEYNLGQNSKVKSSKYISKESALKEYVEESKDDVEGLLEFNPLPDQFEVRLHAGAATKEAIDEFEKEAMSWVGVDEVIYQRRVVADAGAKLGKIDMIFFIFGITLLIISLTLLNNTIRMSILAKRYVITTMKLVGATPWFIMKPFLKRALIQGLLAALLAALMFVGLVSGIREQLPEISLTTDTIELVYIIVGMFILGLFISLFFTLFAVRKMIRLPNDAIYYY